MIVVHTLAEHGLWIDALVVNGDLVLGHIVVDSHFFGSDNREASHFVWIEPTNVNVSKNFAGVFDVEKDHIVDAFLDEVHSGSADRKRSTIV